MKIYSWNVNGLRAVIRKGDFQKFLAKHKPDILCLQETKAERDQVEVDLPERSSSGLLRDRGARSFDVRIPEPGRTPRVYRWQGRDEGSSDALREELRQLRRELEELRKEMRK